MNRNESWGFKAAEGATPLVAISEDVGLEQALLGSILLAEKGYETKRIVERISADDFSNDVHRIIFGSMKQLVEQDQPATFRLLAPLLEGIRATPDKTATSYLGDLLSVAVPPAHAVGYAKALKQHAARRQLKEISALVATASRNPGASLSDDVLGIIDRLDMVCATLRERRASSASFGDAALAVLADMRSGPPEMIRTGLRDLDRVLCGWHRKELSVLAARPGMGKSAFLFSAFLSAARKGTSSLIFSKEMPTEMAIKRMLSDAVWNRDTPIPYAKYARSAIPEGEIQRLEDVARKHAKLPITLDDQVGLSVSEIRSRTKRHIERLDAIGQKLDVVVVDHLGKIKATDRYAGNKVHETGEKTNALAEMAKELDVAIVAAHQLNRGVEGRENKRPDLSDLRDSGNVEEDAESVMFLYRPAYYLNQRIDNHIKDDERKAMLSQVMNDLEVNIAKNRNGPTGTVDLYIDVESNVVRDGARL